MKNHTQIQAVLLTLMMVLVSTVAVADSYKKKAYGYFFLNKQEYKLEQAVEQLNAENKGKVVVAKLEREDDQLYYELKRIEGDKVVEILIDPKTQKVVETDSEWMFSKRSDSDYQKAAGKTAVSMLEAMNIAKKKAEGVILSSSFSYRNSQAIYKVRMVSSQGSTEVLVDAETGDAMIIDNQYRKDHRRSKHH